MIHDGRPLLRGCHSGPVRSGPVQSGGLVPVGPVGPVLVGAAGPVPVGPAGLVLKHGKSMF